MVLGSYTVKPVVCGYEVAAGISDNRTVEFLESFNDVLAKAICVSEGVSWVVNAAIDAPSHVPFVVLDRITNPYSSSFAKDGMMCEL